MLDQDIKTNLNKVDLQLQSLVKYYIYSTVT